MSELLSGPQHSKTFVKLRVLTMSGWLSGMYLKPNTRRLVDALNQGGSAVVLHNAYVPGADEDLAFLTIRRDKMLIVMPDDPEGTTWPSGSVVSTTPRNVVMLAGLATVYGTIEVPQNLRVTDYLSKHKGFTKVRDCRLIVRDPDRGSEWTRSGVEIVINDDMVVAVSEFS